MTHNVLVVDDEPKLCDLLSSALGQNGIQVFTAGNGLHALKVLEQEDIAAQGQAAAEYIQALQFDASALEFAPGVTHQERVGRQHRQQEQHADQAELHTETQAIHQRDGGIEQALHR